MGGVGGNARVDSGFTRMAVAWLNHRGDLL